ncbi:MAG TPA: glycosyltransferase family 39 protein [Gemmatimonadaceae bacterium]|nr:glycosyltransferase family 39 protein [Gemmatimonadaceae bacterium]
MKAVLRQVRGGTISTDPAIAPPNRINDWAGKMPRRWWWVALLLAWLVCAVYAHATLTHGWTPHDSGALGQSAERLLHGQLPHRDFDEIYTGGLSYLYAAAFQVLGSSILVMRLVLYAVFLAWIPAMYYIARQVATRGAALVAVLLAAMWSIPVYPVAIPSWFNLFFASFGIAALFRYLDTDKPRWLFIAGACGGFSCLIKIIGVYYVAAVLLFMMYREQDLSREALPASGRSASVWSTLCLAGFNATLIIMVSRFKSASFQIHFVLPSLLLSIILLRREWKASYAPLTDRLNALARMVAPFLVGVCIPVGLFLVPYIASGSVSALINGLLVRPTRRLDFAAMTAGDGTAVLVLLGVVVAGRNLWRRGSPSQRRRSAIVFGAVLLAAPFVASHKAVYLMMWMVMRALVLLTVVWGSWRLWQSAAMRGGVDRQRVFLLLAAAAICSLVQFPFYAPVYFFYVAPVVVLAALALAWSGDPAIRPAVSGLAIGYILFSVLRIHPASIRTMGLGYVRDDQTVLLTLPRGGVRVSPNSQLQYEALIPLVRARARSSYIYCTPDCPEVYFLAGLRNPTRTIFDFFDEPVDRTTRIMRTLAEHDVHVVSLNQNPEFSGPVPQDLESALEARFPQHSRIGNFIVRWRD